MPFAFDATDAIFVPLRAAAMGRKGDHMNLLYFDSSGAEEDLGLVFMKPIWRHPQDQDDGSRARSEAQRLYEHLQAILPWPTMRELYHLFGAPTAIECPNCGLLIGPWPNVREVS
jgi:hypothetical protein